MDSHKKHKRKKDPAVVYKKTLEAMGAKNVWEARDDVPREREIAQMVKEIAQRRHIEAPPVLIYESDKPNAVSMPGAVAVATNMIDITTPLQLKAVLGHEMSHTRHRWRDMPMLLSIIISAHLVIDALISKVTNRFRPKSKVASGALMVAEEVAPYVGSLMAMKPYGMFMEYEADREGAQIAGPDNMGGALKALRNRVEEIEHTEPPKSWLSRVAKKTAITLFDFHPPMASRLEQMREMEAKQHAANTPSMN